MKTLLLPFYDDDAAQCAFEVSTQIVRQVNGYIEGLFVMRPPQMIDSEGIVLADSYFTQLKDEGRRVADRAQARFEACAAAQGLAIEAVSASKGPAAGWRELEGLEGRVVGDRGRLFDLIVVGRGFGHPWVDWHVIAESALFESGRPVMLTPQTAGSTFGERVIIAWNSSTETARTVALSMPLLALAHSVTVLSIKGWGIPGPSGEELAAHLTRAGVPTTARTADPAGRAPGEAILRECAASGADLLVKGAYTQSRLRQLIFGGATRYVIANAKIPVVLAH